MQVQLDTGYTTFMVELPSTPSEGDYIRYADFTYQVAGNTWTFGTTCEDPPLIPRVHMLPSDIPEFLNFTKQCITAFMPRKGDSIGHADEQRQMVDFLIWVIDRDDPAASRVEYSLGKVVELHPGEARVKEAGERHGHAMTAMTGGNLP
jgi:hypothetical protein